MKTVKKKQFGDTKHQCFHIVGSVSRRASSTSETSASILKGSFTALGPVFPQQINLR